MKHLKMPPGMEFVSYTVPLKMDGVEIGTAKVELRDGEALFIQGTIEGGHVPDFLREHFVSDIFIGDPGSIHVNRAYDAGSDSFEPVVK